MPMRLTLISLANPVVFLRITSLIMPWLIAITLGILAVGLYLAWCVAPPDYQQGETIRIMFLHVPSAWIALLFYAMMTLSAIGSLVWRHPLADIAQQAGAPIGAVFTLICLVTGALWGRPMWGTYWVWDARLTSVLILFLMYCGLISLWRSMEDPLRAARPVSILTLFGLINLPIIRFSVDWWNTLHQPASVLRLEGPAIHPSMLWPLLVMALGLILLALLLHFSLMRSLILERRIRTLTLRQTL
jgi:heme exporter protein C